MQFNTLRDGACQCKYLNSGCSPAPALPGSACRPISPVASCQSGMAALFSLFFSMALVPCRSIPFRRRSDQAVTFFGEDDYGEIAIGTDCRRHIR